MSESTAIQTTEHSEIAQRLESANQALIQAADIQQLLVLRDGMSAFEGWLRQRDAGLESIVMATRIKMRAEHRLGQILSGMPKNSGIRMSGGSILEPPEDTPTYQKLGIKKTAAMRWQQLASLSEDRLSEIIEEAALAGEAISLSRAVKIAVKERQPVSGETPDLPMDRYGVIYADPPWRDDFRRGTGRDIANHYDTMSLEEIMGLGVARMAEDDCVLFLWARAPMLPEALDVMEAWGFEYKTCMVWAKSGIGMGYYSRVNHELLLLGTRGRPGIPDPANRPSSVVRSDKGRHSEKPDAFYGIIEQMYPLHRKVELFARLKRDGWSAWGNEAPAD